MKNYVQPGVVLDFTAGGTITKGTGVLVGQLLVIPVNSCANGETFRGLVEGVANHAKAGSLAVAVGDVAYWDDSAKVFNKTSSGNKEAGWFVSATGAGAGETLADVLVKPQPRTSVAA